MFERLWEGSDGGGDPVPAAEAADTGRIGVEVLQEGLDLGGLLVEGGVDAAFEPAADLLEEPLGRIQLRASGTTALPGCQHGVPQSRRAHRPDTTPTSAAPSARLPPAPRRPDASSSPSAPTTVRAAEDAHPPDAPADTAHTGSPRRPPPPTPPSISVPAEPSVPHFIVVLTLYGTATRDQHKRSVS